MIGIGLVSGILLSYGETMTYVQLSTIVMDSIQITNKELKAFLEKYDGQCWNIKGKFYKKAVITLI